MRGLWERNGKYYAQVQVKDWVGRVHLEHSTTVAEATTAMQALKAEIVAGKFVPPAAKAKLAQNGGKLAQAPGPHSLITEAITSYQGDPTVISIKSAKTHTHEKHSFSAWNKYAPDATLAEIDKKFLKDFAGYRIRVAGEDDKTISGRTINLNVLALKHVVDWAVTEKWLPAFPTGWEWKDLPEKPKKVELLSKEEIEFLINDRIITPEALAMIDESKRYLAEAQQLTGQGFSDYIKLLSVAGAREQETICKTWDHVIWNRRVILFPGALAKAGGGHPAPDREIDFYDRLESHLKDMYARRDTTTSFMFPDGEGGHIGSYRKQWEHARDALKEWKIKQGMKREEAEARYDCLGFHHLRHYFISMCVAMGIDYMTIALWVSHKDGGVLIGKVYGHLRPGHTVTQAAKLNGSTF